MAAINMLLGTGTLPCGDPLFRGYRAGGSEVLAAARLHQPQSRSRVGRGSLNQHGLVAAVAPADWFCGRASYRPSAIIKNIPVTAAARFRLAPRKRACRPDSADAVRCIVVHGSNSKFLLRIPRAGRDFGRSNFKFLLGIASTSGNSVMLGVTIFHFQEIARPWWARTDGAKV
jgi:hypothetical protein